MKNIGFRKKTYEEVLAVKKQKQTIKKPKKRVTKLKRDLMPNRVKRAKKQLELISHTFVRKRDSISPDKIAGYCFDCGKYDEGSQFQAGHWQPSGSCGARLRYHPQNMHGQSGGCNCGYQQEKVKINYTMAMIDKYGIDRVNELRILKEQTIKADIFFYEKMIELYKIGDEQAIVDYLDNLDCIGAF